MSNQLPCFGRVAATLAAGFVSVSVMAGGPLYLNPADPDGVERWPNGGLDIPFNPDGVPAGGAAAPALGPFTWSEAVAETEAAVARWAAVASATQTYSNNGPMPFDIDVTNYAPFIQNLFFGGNTADGFSPIAYDADGTIFVDLFGVSGVLGFASVDTRDVAGNPTEAVMFLNGGAIPPFGTFPVADFQGVIFHEFGHYSGLAHTVVNGQNVLLGDTSGPTPLNTYGDAPQDQVETMYPFAVIGGGQVTPHADDISFLSFLYPSASYFADSGTISGVVLDPTGTTPLTGVNVIARNVADPFIDAASAISGDRGTAGIYSINGLTPGAEYTVHIDQILNGGFSTTPLTFSAPEEFYNGAAESNNITWPDDPADATAVAATAGLPSTGIDVILNAPGPGDPLPVGDDGSVELFLPFAFSLCGQPFSSVFVNANGNVTFGQPDGDFSESIPDHLSGPPRIAGLWDDLNPSQGGIVTYAADGRSFSVIYRDVPEFFATGANSFTITLHAGDNGNGGRRGRDNRFEIEYGTLTAIDGLAGVSCGGFVGSGFDAASDLTALSQPIETKDAGGVFELFDAGNPNDLSDENLAFKATKGAFDVFEPNDSAGAARRVNLPFDTLDRFSEIAPIGSDVDWYRFEAEAGKTLIAEVIGGQLDSVLGLFRLGRGQAEPVQVAFDDDGGAGLLSQIVFPIAESGQYAIAVSSFPDADFSGDGNSGGRYVLDVRAVDGTVISLGDDSTLEVDLGFTFPFQGQSWTSVFVNSNGNLTFGTGDTDFSESIAEFLNGPPRVAALWDDLSPNQGGLVLVSSDASSFSVTFDKVPEFLSPLGNTFTITLDATGAVSVDYGNIAANDGIAGVTEGEGAADPGPTDLSATTGLSAQGTTYEQFGFSNPNDLELLMLNYLAP